MADWIDITRPLVNGMICWPGDEPFHWEQIGTITGPGTCNLSRMRTGMHVGTHIDAPLHLLADGVDVASLPLDRLCGPAIVVDVPGARDVTVGDLVHAGVRPRERVLLRTLNRTLWSKPVFDEEFIGLSSQAVRWLVDQAVPAVGVDYLSIDRYHDPVMPAHSILLGAGVVVIEGVNLDQVAPGRYEMVALPLRIPRGEGSPARVIIRPV